MKEWIHAAISQNQLLLAKGGFCAAAFTYSIPYILLIIIYYLSLF